jgi:hypothetical protein
MLKHGKARWPCAGLALMLAPVLMAGTLPTQPGKIDPSKLPPASKLKAKNLPLKLALTDVVWQVKGGFSGVNPDGSHELASAGDVIASVEVDAAPGVDTAAKLVLGRSDQIWCPGNKPANSINPLWPVTVPGAPQGQQLLAKASVSGDTYLLAGKCSQGLPERAITTFIATVTTKSGAVYASKLVVKANHFNE